MRDFKKDPQSQSRSFGNPQHRFLGLNFFLLPSSCTRFFLQELCTFSAGSFGIHCQPHACMEPCWIWWAWSGRLFAPGGRRILSPFVARLAGCLCARGPSSLVEAPSSLPNFNHVNSPTCFSSWKSCWLQPLFPCLCCVVIVCYPFSACHCSFWWCSA